MSEVEIICLGDTAHVRDLGLNLVRGAKVLTTLSAVSNSRDLNEAKLLGLVSVRVMRAQVIKREDFPVVPPSAETPTNSRSIVRSAYHPSSPATHEIRHEIHDDLISELLHEIRGLREDLQKRSKEQPPTVQTTAAITAAIQSALQGLSLNAGVGVASPVATKSAQLASEPEPMFIPRGIVSGAKAEITTTTVTTETSSSFEDAQAALKKARKDLQGV